MKKAEALLIQEYDEILRWEKRMSSPIRNNAFTSSHDDEQSMEPICLLEKPLPVPRTVGKRIQWAIEQKLGYYATTGTPKQNFESYWSSNQHKLPILSSLVRRFCISPATSVASESSFSYANYVQRKQRSSLSSTNLYYTMLLRGRDTIKQLNDIY